MARKDDSYTIADTTPPGRSGKPLIWALLAVVVVAVGAVLYFMNRTPDTTASTSPTGAQQTAETKAPAKPASSEASAAPPSGGPAKSSESAPPPAPVPAKPAAVGSVKEVVHFGFNEAAVPASDAAKVEGVCRQAGSSPGTVEVLGHADSVGSDEYNQTLSARRAESVAALLRACGIGKGQSIRAQGLGKSKPIGDNDTEQGRAANRRVEIGFTSK